MSRLLSSAITIRLTKQIYIAGQHLCCVLHLILQLLGLCIAQSFGETTPYRLKVEGWVMRPNHRKDMSSDVAMASRLKLLKFSHAALHLWMTVSECCRLPLG